MKVELTGIPETMMITLWARAVETLKEKPLIKDPYAADMIKKLDYDFGKYKNVKMSQSGVIVRTMLFDEIVRDLIKNNPDASIVNLGAGADARFFRVDNGRIRWYDLDLPEVMEIRKHFFQETDRYKMISKSALDYTWIDEIKNRDKPVLFVAEGFFMFLSGENVKELLIKLQENFPQGELLAEVLSVFISKNAKRHEAVKKTNAEFGWGINDPKELEKTVPGMVFKKEWNYFEYGKKFWRPVWLLSRLFPPLKKHFGMRIVNMRLNNN